ncbi:MAG: DOMON-like domain-containing protein [Gammaproteobacteria bacterium]
MTSLATPLSRNLVCHPRTPSRSIGAIKVQVVSATNGILALTFVLQGNLASLRIPAERPGRRMDELWRQTCFEAFLMAGDGPGYREYNFSPSGEWAAYAFSDYRQGDDQQAGVTTDESDPVLRVHRSSQRLALEAEIPSELPPLTRPIRVGLSAVVEAVNGDLSYWALRHPPGKPDFHHADAFALQLDGS